jgi:hypothetical protein
MLHALAIALAAIAACSMLAAIVGMAAGNQSALTGWIVRVVALVCFAAAVILNAAAH